MRRSSTTGASTCCAERGWVLSGLWLACGHSGSALDIWASFLVCLGRGWFVLSGFMGGLFSLGSWLAWGLSGLGFGHLGSVYFLLGLWAASCFSFGFRVGLRTCV